LVSWELDIGRGSLVFSGHGFFLRMSRFLSPPIPVNDTAEVAPGFREEAVGGSKCGS
jgi:hypothetical protein